MSRIHIFCIACGIVVSLMGWRNMQTVLVQPLERLDFVP